MKLNDKNLFWALGGLLLFMAAMTPMALAGSLVTGDFNNDGFADFAIRTGDSRSVCVWLSNGDGTFQRPVCYMAGPAPMSILAGDLNNDGNLDLLALNPERGPLVNGVAVLLGNGDGTFQTSRLLYPAGAYPRLFSLADLNGDGNLDVAVVGLGGPCTLLGDGAGSLLEPRCVYLRGFNEAHTLLTPDLAGEGRGAFVGVSPNNICVWFGTTREPRCTPTRIVSRLAIENDFTEDGIPDVALVGFPPSGGSINACVYAGDEFGGFQLTSCTPVRTTVNINLIATADLNGDAHADLVLAGSGRAGGEVIILLGNGSGGFAASRLAAPIAPVIEALAVADIDGDGVPDLIIAGSNRACVFIGQGDGQFGDPQCFPLRTP
ncbi:MAG: VCBS repeat-containing protein [Acidobacteria bacterium]|nr:VCBS repeat-containing protein [Acidobacteriota bacterium]MBI3655660.1 VCBS repeat-containing protein [Acidobacteriota bacterium]